MHVVLFEPSSQGGQARYAADLARALAATARADDVVDLVVPRDFPYGSESHGVHRVLPRLKGTRRGGRGLNLAALLLRHTQQVGAARRRVRGTTPTIVHLLNTGLLAPSLIRQTARVQARLVATVHDLPIPVAGRTPRTRLLLRRWSRRLPDADLILVHGAWSAQRLSDAYPRERLPIAVLAHPRFEYGQPSAPRDVLRRRIGVPSNAPLALHFGNLRREKGLDVLIEALADERLGRWHLLVAGTRSSRSEPSTEQYRAIATAHGVADRVIWREGYIPEDEVADVFHCADVVVLPYRATFAGQSGVLTIAASYGVPVVASAVGEMRDAVTENSLGRCVPPDSPAALATALAEVSRGPRHGPPARSEWPTFDQVATGLWTLYRRVAEKEGNPA